MIFKSGKIFKDSPLSENVFAGYSKSGELLEIQILDISESEHPWLTVSAVAKYLNKSERTILR